MNLKGLTLETVCNGAADELFEAELASIIQNIEDPNTEAKDKRKIVFEFTFEPNAERNFAEVSLQTKTTMAKMRPASGGMILDSGKALTNADKQQPLFADVKEIK